MGDGKKIVYSKGRRGRDWPEELTARRPSAIGTLQNSAAPEIREIRVGSILKENKHSLLVTDACRVTRAMHRDTYS